ncbi:uncharacterized protein LOC142608791 [Castanea sativa]|uniref:uncharacterized protein LOC142608791 n=1 Tax=Castanea sativa TaxID=21020 RepID=UPI003F64CB85
MLFLPHEVLLIQSIPLSQRPVEDKLVWSFNRSGVYTVKSGYKLLSQEVKVSDFKAQGVDNEVWKMVWGLKVQNKIKNFIWRAIRNSILMKSNLVKRKILIDDSCDHYHHDLENVLHALWQCPLLDPVWNSNPCWSFRASTQFSSFGDLVSYMSKEGLNLELFAQISWTIWFRKNQLRTSSKPFPVAHVIPDALAALSAFICAIPPKPPNCETRPPLHTKWKPLDPNSLKVNFDGAVFREDNMAGVGVIICDEKGQIIAFMAEKVPLSNSVATLEAIAAVKALNFAAELGISSVVVEGDSELVSKALLSEDISFADHGHLVEEAKLLSALFPFCRLSHVRR